MNCVRMIAQGGGFGIPIKAALEVVVFDLFELIQRGRSLSGVRAELFLGGMGALGGAVMVRAVIEVVAGDAVFQ